MSPILIGLALITYSLYTPLPTKNHPIRFYSTHTRHDIKLTLIKAIQSAQTSIYLHTYALTDTSIIHVLQEQARKGVDIHLFYHKKNTPHLHKLATPNFHLYPIKGSGLMHEKIWIIDKRLVFLGSANLTYSSLKMHDNFVLGIHSPELASLLTQSRPIDVTLNVGCQTLRYFSLPNAHALDALLHALDQAKNEVVLALFTFTHPKIVHKLQELHKRGVHIELHVDRYTAKGASKQALQHLYQSGIVPYTRRGTQLFHHKWALIDRSTFILGSANWTQAAFKKNRDFIVFLSPLTTNQTRDIERNLYNIKKYNNIEFNNN